MSPQTVSTKSKNEAVTRTSYAPGAKNESVTQTSNDPVSKKDSDPSDAFRQRLLSLESRVSIIEKRFR
jgi:hypothetical protein